MSEQSGKPSVVQRFDDTVEVLAKRARNLGTLGWAALIALSTIGSAVTAVWLYLSPGTYGAIVNWGRSFLSPREQPFAKTEAPPASVKSPPPSDPPAAPLVKCERNLTRMIEALEAYRERVSGGQAWTHQQLFQDSVMGRPFCIVAKAYRAAEKRDGQYRTTFHSSMRLRGELYDVFIYADTRESPQFIPESANALVKGTLTDFYRISSIGPFDLRLTDAAISERWAEALQEASKAD